MLIWYLPIVNLLSFLPVLMHSRCFFCKWFKLCYCVLYGTNVRYLTSQNKFLEDLRYQKFVILLPPGNHGVSKEKLPFQKTVSPKSLWIQPWNRPWILNKSGLWIYKNSEYARVMNMPLVLKVPDLYRVLSVPE